MNVAVCASMAARLAAQGVPCERLTVIPNWADGELIRPITRRDNPLRTAWGLGERLVLGYSGNLGCAHLVDPVVELITLLADEPKLAFLFIGAGSGYGALRAAAWSCRANCTARSRPAARSYSSATLRATPHASSGTARAWSRAPRKSRRWPSRFGPAPESGAPRTDGRCCPHGL